MHLAEIEADQTVCLGTPFLVGSLCPLVEIEIEILSKFCTIRPQLSFVRMMELCQGSKDHENLTSTAPQLTFGGKG